MARIACFHRVGSGSIPDIGTREVDWVLGGLYRIKKTKPILRKI
jgi:hypothetical protein